MEKWCPKCQKRIADPGTCELTKYAKFWRDNRCYYCGSTLHPVSASSSPAGRVDESRRIGATTWEWLNLRNCFVALLIALVVSFVVSGPIAWIVIVVWWFAGLPEDPVLPIAVFYLAGWVAASVVVGLIFKAATL